jgi:Putative zinc-finger
VANPDRWSSHPSERGASCRWWAGSDIAVADDGRETLFMTCRDAIDVIAEFLDHVLSPGAVEELEAHLRDCGACRAYLNTYQKTRGLVGQTGRVEMPDEMRARLRRFLLDQLGAPPS